MNELSNNEEDVFSFPVWIIATIAAVVIIGSIRLFTDFKNPYPVGVDAGSYAVQVRSILETGRLWQPDLPLAYYLFALIGAICRMFGMDSSHAALLGSRLGDGILPSLAAIPMMAAAHRWSMARVEGMVAGASLSVFALLSPGPMRMISDFQKQAVGLVWLSAIFWAIGLFVVDRNVRSGMILGAFVLLAALTHIGIAGASVIALTICAIALAIFGSEIPAPRRVAAATGILLGGVALVIAVNVAAPNKAGQLGRGLTKLTGEPTFLTVFTQTRGISFQPENPLRQATMHPADTPSRGLALAPPGSPADWFFGDDRPPNEKMSPPPEVSGRVGVPPMVPGGLSAAPPRGGPRGVNDLVASAQLTIGASLLALVIGMFAWRTSGLDTRIVLVGSATTALALSCPLIAMEQYSRLVIMSSVPAAWALLTAVTSTRSASIPMILSPVAAGLAIYSQVASGSQPPMDAMSDVKLAQLRSLKSKLPKSGSTVIVARHGLEFWVTYALRVRSTKSDLPSLRDSFQHVLRLEEAPGGSSGGIGASRPGTLIGSTGAFRLYRVELHQ